MSPLASWLFIIGLVGTIWLLVWFLTVWHDARNDHHADKPTQE
jgi:hypothetical protein